MKNRKTQFQKFGIAVFVIAVTGIATCAVQYNNHKQFDLTVGEHSIGKEEYLNFDKAIAITSHSFITRSAFIVNNSGSPEPTPTP